MQKFRVSERLACRVLGQHRSTQRKVPRGRPDEEALTADIIALASQYGRYGYRRITALLREAGWVAYCCDARSYDFVENRTHDGRRFRMLNLIDEFTRECLAIRIDRRLRSTDVIDVLSDQFILRGVPDHIRSDNGPEFVATAVREWIAAVGARTAYIEPGSPWENGYCEARIVIEGWRKHYNTKRPHSSLGYRPPAPEVVQWPAPPSGAASPATPAVAPRPIMH